MRLANLRASTAFRLVVILIAAYVTTFAIAGAFGLFVVADELDERVTLNAHDIAATLEATYRASGLDAATSAIRTVPEVGDDVVVWLADPSGVVLAGPSIVGLTATEDDNVDGMTLGLDEDDEAYSVVVRDLDGATLVVAVSNEDADEITEVVVVSFVLATLVALAVALAIGSVLARRSHHRLIAVTDTLSAVASGRMAERVPTRGTTDDLDRLSEKVNVALTQLESTVDQIRQVANDIAHDLRHPLGRLRISIERARSPGNASDVEEALDTALSQVTDMAATFDALLSIATLESGRQRDRFVDVDLNPILSMLHETYAPVAEDNGQIVSAEIPSPDAVIVRGDARLVTQLLANLIENAIRHSPAGAQLSWGTHSNDGGTVAVWVADDGPGIPAADRDKVLRRFFRLDRSRTTTGGGLGLALVKAIADLHAANLSLDDAEPGLRVTLTFNGL